MKNLILFVFIILSWNLKCQPNWPLTKSNTTLQVAIPAEFGVPVAQPLSVNGWEDGIFISRNGLNLYCIYLPADALSWSTNGAPCVFAPYQKGPTYGMDLTTSPTTVCPTWLQGDILISSRTSTNQAFPSWTLSNLSGPIYSEGAPQFTMLNSTTSDIVVYTSNQLPPYNADIYLIKNSTVNPSLTGTILPAPITQTTTEDNPHLERLSANQLVLFFDSPDRSGGVGGLDIWTALSNDDGLTWTTPIQVSTINTNLNEHQPHLYKDNFNQWWLYYTTPDGSGKYAIYRAQQTIPNNWNSWGPKQLVVGPGNSAGIGEPTLTQNGDLSFVVVYQDANGTPTDKFDADPWFLPHTTITSISKNNSLEEIGAYPNPATESINLKFVTDNTETRIQIYNYTGNFIKESSIINSSVNINDLEKGIYFFNIKKDDGHKVKFIKE
ncbi:MAG: T9SS type A sorting domain-containing protein [Bacteroidetes bacterium]|nr:T9SS type A sorting domain-containing protein [Bacteroidota bacterium]